MKNFFHTTTKKLSSTTFVILICLGSINLSAQWQAFTPSFPDTVGVFDVRVAPGNHQIAWSCGMKFKVTASTYSWVQGVEPNFSKTTDGGQTWTGGTIPLGVTPYINNISPINGDVAWESHTGWDNKIQNFVQKTIDGGKTWTRFMKDQFADDNSYVNFVHFWDAQRGIAAGDPIVAPGQTTPFFEIYLTTDGGKTWSRVPSANIPARLTNEYGSTGVYQVKGNTIWFATFNIQNFQTLRLFRSNDGGQNWEAFDTPKVGFFAFADALNGIYSERITGNKLQLRRTTDGGKTWSIVNGSPGNDLLTSMTIVPESQIIVASQRTNNLNPPFFTKISKDWGETWLDISTGDENVGAMQFASPTVGYAGEWQPAKHPTRMYKYVGSSLVGLFSGKELTADVNTDPNPTTDFLNVKIETARPLEFVILLNEASGKLVERKNLTETDAGQARFDLKNLPAGVYFLTVSCRDGWLTKKVVKQ